MKLHGNLLSRIITDENLLIAHQRARKGKGWYEEVRAVDLDIEQGSILHQPHSKQERVYHMIEHGQVRAVVAPEAVVVDANSVWVAKNVQEVTVQDEQGERTEYEFSLTQYTKDEYIHLLICANETQEMDIINTQLALCDVYEMITTM